jgi:hypothetical protein
VAVVPATARAARVALTVVTAAVVPTARPRLHPLLPKLRLSKPLPQARRSQ